MGRDSDSGPPEYKVVCTRVLQFTFFFRYKVSMTAKDPEAAYKTRDPKGSFDPFKERKLDHPTT